MTLFVDIQVLPVHPRDKRAAFAIETGWMVHRMDAFERSREISGWTIERVALMETPVGNFTIAYHESMKPAAETARIHRTSDDVFDRDMRTRGNVLHGLSEAEQLEHRVPRELVIDYGDPPARRGDWIAFAAVIQPGRVDAWRALCGELRGARGQQFAEFNRRNGILIHRSAIFHARGGDAACFYLEGTDPASLPAALARGGAFEQWFADTSAAVFGADLRAGLPYRPVGICWDWVKGGSNEHVAPLAEQVATLIPG